MLIQINKSLLRVVAPSLFTALGAFSSSSVLADNVTKVYFTGEIVESACGLASDSVHQTVQLGQYPTHVFKAKGDRTQPVPFTIRLTDCDTNIAQIASFTFYANPDSSGKLFQVDGGAQGIGVRLFYNHQPLDNGAVATMKTLADGENVTHFAAAYEANTDVTTSPVTVGRAQSWALLKVAYQ